MIHIFRVISLIYFQNIGGGEEAGGLRLGVLPV